ncbi:hypothetical protein [uncultured Piscinibacter sp.]|uniref:hypothetical protein n=1 Tax=uncultured Piscinibacter sp. TaxID=1131835 RepID=UPI002607B4C8|nr:hypothetical protein [uncultured Piscinibacter sp.]
MSESTGRGPRAAVMVLVLLAGCASTSPLPAEFDRRQLSVLAPSADVDPVATTPSGKGEAALAGAAGGAGVGAVSGGLACLGAGPLAPLCFAVIVPATTLATAVGTGVAMAVMADSDDVVERKRAMLRAGLDGADGSRRLAEAVAAQLGTVVNEAPAAPADTDWRIEVILRRVATTGRGVDDPFRLSAEGEIRLRRPGAGEPLFTQQRLVRSEAAHALAAWQADDAFEARRALDTMIVDLARALADSLR